MGREVARLVPRTKPIEEAVLSFDGARFHDCLTDLHGNAAGPARILRARALLRLNLPGDVLEALGALPAGETFTHAQSAEIGIVRAAASMRVASYTRAHQSLANAWVHVVSAGDVAIEAEFAYYEALLAWLEGRFEEAVASALAIDALAVPDEAWLRPSATYLVSLAATKARALELRAFDAGRVGKLADQMRLLRRGLAVLRDDAYPDRFVEVGLLRNLAIVVRETGSLADAEAIAKRVDDLAWTPELGEQRYHIVRALGWCRALAGDHVGALRRFREAARLASAPAWQLFAVVDRAYLSIELGQHICAEEEIAHARDLSLAIDWEKTAGEEASALLLLAQLVAGRDPAEAERLLERYRAARAHGSALAFGALDPRVKASESYARGHVALARGDAVAARRLFIEAFATWHQIGSKWRAALAASDLDRLCGDVRYARYAEREIAKRPTSWLALRRAALAS